MSQTSILIIAAAIAGLAGLGTWAWLATKRLINEPFSLDGFEGMHFEE